MHRDRNTAPLIPHPRPLQFTAGVSEAAHPYRDEASIAVPRGFLPNLHKI
jgi:hypothetical protein